MKTIREKIEDILKGSFPSDELLPFSPCTLLDDLVNLFQDEMEREIRSREHPH